MNLILRTTEDIERIEEPVERLAALLRLHIEVVTREQGLFTVFLDERASLEDRRRARDFEREYLHHVITTVEAAMAAGVLPPGDPHLTALAVVGMMTWIYKWYDPERHDAGLYAKVCEALLVRGHGSG